MPLGRRLSGDRSVGMKIWIYRNQTSSSNLTISLVDSPELILSFNFSLNFKGWRAAWVALEEAKSVPKNPGYDQIVFQAPMHADVIFVDLLCLCPVVYRQTRDEFVPPIGRSIYTITSLWQQVYRWSRMIPKPVDGTTPLTESEKAQLRNLTLIEKRVLNWFANESLGPSHYRGDLKKRWESLVVDGFQNARKCIKELNITLNEGVLTGSPLFTKYSEFGNSTKVGGNKKLGWVAINVLFPLTLEYYSSTKPQHVNDQVERELEHVNSAKGRAAAVRRLTNEDAILGAVMSLELRAFKSTPVAASDLRT